MTTPTVGSAQRGSAGGKTKLTDEVVTGEYVVSEFWLDFDLI